MNNILISELILLVFSIITFFIIYIYQGYQLKKVKQKLYYSKIQEKENEYLISKILEIK